MGVPSKEPPSCNILFAPGCFRLKLCCEIRTLGAFVATSDRNSGASQRAAINKQNVVRFIESCTVCYTYPYNNNNNVGLTAHKIINALKMIFPVFCAKLISPIRFTSTFLPDPTLFQPIKQYHPRSAIC